MRLVTRPLRSPQVIAAIFFIATISTPLRVADVDVCELNHKIDSDGQPQFDQVILWRWVPQWPKSATHHVSEYFMIDSDVRVDWKLGKRRVTWRDKSGQCYEVNCTTFRETTTRHDPEVADREPWPVEIRRPYFESRQ